jgi:dsDNA-binding SOS-regulon protein
METINVAKDRLLATLKQNREDHLDLFLKAQEGYRLQVIEVLDERLQQARDGKQVSTFINLPEPKNYTEAFDTAISMVEWAEGATIELDQRDFERYVLNKWEWAQAFIATNSQYVGS